MFHFLNVLCQISHAFDRYVESLDLVKNNSHCSVGMFQLDLNFSEMSLGGVYLLTYPCFLGCSHFSASISLAPFCKFVFPVFSSQSSLPVSLKTLCSCTFCFLLTHRQALLMFCSHSINDLFYFSRVVSCLPGVAYLS